jgi:hypothetical protein
MRGKQHQDHASKLDVLRAAAQAGVASFERGDYQAFATADDLVAYLNDVADRALSGTDTRY